MSEIIQTKRCSKCKQIKPLSKFYRNRTRKDGYHHQCKHCQNQYKKQYRQDYSKQYRRRYRSTIRGHLMDVWHLMLRRCNNSKNKSYKWYGLRGIKVKFASFNDFCDYVVKELKVDPRRLTIDRINNDGH